MVHEYLSNHEIAFLAGAEKTAEQLLTIDARTLEITSEKFINCVGDASNYNAVSHELRADTAPGHGAAGAFTGEGLLTTAYIVKSYADEVAVPSFAAGQLNARFVWFYKMAITIFSRCLYCLHTFEW